MSKEENARVFVTNMELQVEGNTGSPTALSTRTSDSARLKSTEMGRSWICLTKPANTKQEKKSADERRMRNRRKFEGDLRGEWPCTRPFPSKDTST